jgi:glutamate racemase
LKFSKILCLKLFNFVKKYLNITKNLFNLKKRYMKDKAIGVFDSGAGGLSVLKQFIRFLPFERYKYLGDTARVPYGSKSTDTVKRYARESTEFLLRHDVKMIVVACNTVSSVALDVVREMSDVPVIGMILPAVAAAIRATINGRIGIIGTRATIGSNNYALAIKELADSDNIQVFSQHCPLFVPLVEEGWLRHDVTRMVAEEYLSPFREYQIDTLVLACTHYPLLSQLIAEIMPGITLIDTGEHASVTALRVLAEKDFLVDERNEFVIKPEVEFFVTDVPTTFYDIAKCFLGFSVESPKVITLGKS